MYDYWKPVIEGGKPIRDKPIIALPELTDEEINEIIEVLKSGKWTMSVGSKIREFEEEFRKYINVKHAIAVSSGTTALHLALRAVGVSPGDEVITTPFTFVATASTIIHQNAIPIFADISIEDYNIDPNSIRESLSDKTKAVVVVHLCGQPVEIEEIKKICEEENVALIEDCAQAIGAEYKGVKVGCIGDVNAFSFYISKNITTGEGGMVTTNNDEIAEAVRLMRSHGEKGKYHYVTIGYNYRMTEIQAVLGILQLRKIEKLNSRRREIVKIYNDELNGFEAIKTPIEKKHVKHVWHIYNILLEIEKLSKSRDEIYEAIRRENVYVSVAYPTPLYMEPIFQELIGHGKGCPWKCPYYNKEIIYKAGICPNAEDVSKRVITLPTQPSLKDDDVIEISRAVKKIVKYYLKK
ncbi:MAG: DegT/DnrJ/EryC1/StrS family aminotransferase [Candidatus Methanomethylicia archaeon]|nr:DegT/DnrJ/EryC1/StrS family aminotransferase [Candidatus Methanomethylicia archaeon]MDW7988500.1 DegT/DnrJ/EryC1/StrS family aminotransferase [Nitrososphaerota archaeon]